MNRKDHRPVKRNNSALHTLLQQEADKNEEARRQATDKPILKEIGDNNTNQYRKSGNSI